MQSKLYGTVILLSFRNTRKDLKFEAAELNAKAAALPKSTIQVELEGPKVAIPGTD